MQTLTRTSPPITTRRDTLMAELETIWSHLDALLNTFTPTQWPARHGKDWTYADLPFHLAYFDRDMVVEAILQGPDAPTSAQIPLQGSKDVDAWNATYFNARPTTHTLTRSLTEMHNVRDLIRRLVASRDDADLNRPVFVRLLGWTTVYDALATCHTHTWRHYIELRLRLKSSTPSVSPTIANHALDYLMQGFPAAMNPTAAAALKKPFTFLMAFTGEAGGAWTFHVENSICTLTKGRALNPDLTITQSPEDFIRLMSGMLNPMLALLTGRMKVQGLKSMSTFGKLFPPPGN